MRVRGFTSSLKFFLSVWSGPHQMMLLKTRPFRRALVTVLLLTACRSAGDGVPSRPMPTVRSELAAVPAAFWGDLKGTFADVPNLLVLGGAWALGELGSDFGVDEAINERLVTEQQLDLDKDLTEFLDFAGGGAFELGLAAGLWGAGHLLEDSRLHEAGKRSLAALATTGTATLLLKATINETRPNGGSNSFPSGHTSTSFAFADSMRRSYGWKLGIPLYLFASGVALERLDSGSHEFEDVVFGAALGLVASKTVHMRRDGTDVPLRVSPFVSAGDRAFGVIFHFSL